LSLMFIDSKLEPVFYCERCCHAVPAQKTPAPEILAPALV